mgnify:CR=1 FL=1
MERKKQQALPKKGKEPENAHDKSRRPQTGNGGAVSPHQRMGGQKSDERGGAQTSPVGISRKAVPFEEDVFFSYAERAFIENGIPTDLYFSEGQKARYAAFFRRLFEVNAYTNLTAIRSVPEAVVKHLIDSLTILPLLPQNAKILDVGCGGGFPSLPLAIARPDLTIVALDSTAKKIDFVNDVIASLQLRHITAMTERAEEFAHTSARASFDCVISRAVANMTALAEITLPFVRKNGFVLAMKGPGGREELDAAGKMIQTLGGDLSQTTVHPLSLHFPKMDLTENEALNGKMNEKTMSSHENEERILLKIPKVKETPDHYPRPWAQILKSVGNGSGN